MQGTAVNLPTEPHGDRESRTVVGHCPIADLPVRRLRHNAQRTAQGRDTADKVLEAPLTLWRERLISDSEPGTSDRAPTGLIHLENNNHLRLSTIFS